MSKITPHLFHQIVKKHLPVNARLVITQEKIADNDFRATMWIEKSSRVFSAEIHEDTVIVHSDKKVSIDTAEQAEDFLATFFYKKPK